jgi:hypothetical protein
VSQAIVDRLIDKLKYTVGSTGLRRMWIEKIEQQRSPRRPVFVWRELDETAEAARQRHLAARPEDSGRLLP